MTPPDSPLTDIESSGPSSPYRSPSAADVTTFELTPAFFEMPNQFNLAHENVPLPNPAMQGVEGHEGPFYGQQQTPNSHTKSTIQALQIRFLDTVRYLELATMELQDFSDIYGEPGDDTFQPPQFRLQNNLVNQLENLRTQRCLREGDVYEAATQLMRHSDFLILDDTAPPPEDFPWRLQVPMRAHIHALRHTQRLFLEHAHATLLILRYIGAEIHACRTVVHTL